MEWLPLLRQAIGANESAGHSLVATFATVDAQMAPAARSVIVRQITDDGTFWFTSHAMSQKNNDLRQHPRAAFVLWFPATREQFRVDGSVKVLNVDNDPGSLLGIWTLLPDATRATFYWPHPDTPRNPDLAAFPQTPPAGKPEPPETFEVLVFTPRVVDHLDLRQHPHHRRNWIRNRDDKIWSSELLNP